MTPAERKLEAIEHHVSWLHLEVASLTRRLPVILGFLGCVLIIVDHLLDKAFR